jgi:hypothetical protein
MIAGDFSIIEIHCRLIIDLLFEAIANTRNHS